MDERAEQIRDYRDLIVWKEAMDIAEDVYRLTRQFPREEMFSMTSQLRRCAASIPANIAEGYGRGTRKDYVRHLMIAQGSLKELETHLIIAAEVDCAAKADLEPILDRCDQLGRGLGSLIRALRAKID